VRLARLQARGVAQEEARRRMAAQASEEERRARADFVVSNDGTLDDLDRELDGILTKLGRDDAS
jgi:dephospho-CoA kinase